jgi:hypothetical protein
MQQAQFDMDLGIGVRSFSLPQGSLPVEPHCYIHFNQNPKYQQQLMLALRTTTYARTSIVRRSALRTPRPWTSSVRARSGRERVVRYDLSGSSASVSAEPPKHKPKSLWQRYKYPVLVVGGVGGAYILAHVEVSLMNC